MDPITIALLGSSFVGGLLNKNKQKQKTSGTSTTSPTFAPEFLGVRDRLLRSAGRAPTGFSLARNATNQTLQGITGAGADAELGLRAKLAASGIRGPAAGSAIGKLGSSIFGAQAGAISNEPLLAHDFDMEQMDRLLQVLGMGRGSTTTSTGTGTSESGGGIGGGFSDLGEMLGFLSAQGKLGFGKKTTFGGGV